MTSADPSSDTQPARAVVSKRALLTTAAVVTIVLLVLTTRPWAEGTVSDTITGALHSTVHGSAAAPTAVAGGLVAAASVVALLASRRIGRVVAALAMVLGGALAAYGSLRVALDPAGVLREKVAAESGHAAASVTGATASLSVWPAAACSVVLVLLGVLALVVGGRWAGLSRRYDAPAEASVSDWDRLSAGTDPTAADDRED